MLNYWSFIEEKINLRGGSFFRLKELTGEELLHEKLGIHNLRYIKDVGGTEDNPICRYSFQAQDFDIKPKSEAKLPEGEKYGSFILIDQKQGYVDIKKKADLPHAESVFSFDLVRSGQHHKTLMKIAEWACQNGIDSSGKFRSGRDLLLKHSPRFTAETFIIDSREKLQQKGETSVEAAIRIAEKLDSGVLAIQGPPGAGKTYLASRVIIALAKKGKKIGVSALSHKVIRNLLDRVGSLCAEDNLDIKCIHKKSEKSSDVIGHVEEFVGSNKKFIEKIEDYQVIGGTSWLWSHETFTESVDYLFIDEAGQFSLADTLAVSQAGKNLILLGDPQQLERPIKGTHPEDTDVSALHHIMGENTVTIAEEKGLFLKDTWRMHPDICSFISEQFYANKLESIPDCSNQKLISSSFPETGVVYKPVEHQGRQSSSPEEVEEIIKIYEKLLSSTSWVDRDNTHKKLTSDDILLITPYNAQVKFLAQALPNARVGTVDKFQGQEAAVVIYSLATSSAEEAPRGMDFLYSQSRLNVAISRAKVLSIMVGSPEVFFPDCRDPFQIKLVNSFCRYKEVSM